MFMGMIRIDETLREMERVWEVGSLPGRQSCEQNEAWRQLWQSLQEPTAARAPAHLGVVR
jgi:hypothetical protein